MEPNQSATTITTPNVNSNITPPANQPPISNPQPASGVYPTINIPHIENPSRFYAFPVIGILAKIITLIPVFIWIGILGFVAAVLTLINSFIVVFKGKYWQHAYEYNLGLMRLNIKLSYFLAGLTNKYPGFSRNINDNFTVDIPYPENPNKLFAIPLIGGIIRIILLIPYFIYRQVVDNASNIGVLFSFVRVLFRGKYPESTFELARDSVRVSQASTAYMAGLSDKYPSFYISMSHKKVKIFLIVLGILLAIYQIFSQVSSLSQQANTSIPNPSQRSSVQLR